MNLLLLFGVLLALGTLGGLLAARLRWLPTITSFMALGLLVGPSGLGLLSKEALLAARPLVDIALGLILFQLCIKLHPWLALRNKLLMVTSLVESAGTFSIILVLMLLIGSPLMLAALAALAAAIAVSSSPAELWQVAQELHAKGPTVDAAVALVVGAVMLALGLAQALKVSNQFAALALGIACR